MDIDTFDRILSSIHIKIEAKNFNMNDPQILFDLHNTFLKKFYLTNRKENDNLVDKYWDGYYYNFFPLRPTRMSPQSIREIFSDIFLETLPYVKHYFQQYSPSQKIIMLTMLKKLQLLDSNIFETFFNELATEFSNFNKEDTIQKKFATYIDFYQNKDLIHMVEL